MCARAPPAGRRRPPPGAAGSRRAGMPPLLAPLLCLALLPALAARGRRPPAASPQLSAPSETFGSALGARPGWLGAGGQGGEGDRATWGRVGAGVPGSGRRTDPPLLRLPHRGGLTRLAPGTEFGARFEAGLGPLGARETQSWARPSPAARGARRRGGRTSCLLLFGLNRVGFGFLLPWGHLSFFFASCPRRGRMLGRGAWSVGSGAPRWSLRSRTAGPGRRAWWAEGSWAGPAGPASFPSKRVCAGPGRGARTQATPGSWPPRPRCPLPTPGRCPHPGSVWGGGRVCGRQLLLMGLSLCGVQVWKPGGGGRRGGGGHSSLHFTSRGSPRNRMVINSSLPLKVGGSISSPVPEVRVRCHTPPRPPWGASLHSPGKRKRRELDWLTPSREWGRVPSKWSIFIPLPWACGGGGCH